MFTIHIAAVFLSVGVVLLADKEGFAWIRGKKETLDPKRLQLYHTLTWIGLLSLIATGAILAFPGWRFLVTQPLFLLKMFFVALLVINAFVIGHLMHIATERPFRSLSQSEKIKIFASGAVSTISWSGAILAALYFFG